MNVEEISLRSYMEALHDTVKRVGEAVFEPMQANGLLHNTLLPSKITGYVSTQFGVAIEYSPADSSQIQILRGSARVETLVFSGPRQLHSLPLMLLVRGAGSSLGGGGTFADGFPLRLASGSCDFVVDNFNFQVGFLNWKRHVHYLELYGDRIATLWSVESAIARGKDEVLAALYLARQAARGGRSLADYVQQFREKSVLVFGSYNTLGIARIKIISNELRLIGYEPVLVADIPDFERYDLVQKVVAIAAVCRFILIDDSAPPAT